MNHFLNLFILLTVAAFTSTASAGTLVSAKHCTSTSLTHQKCTNIPMPSSRSCNAKSTTLSNARATDSSFYGTYSIAGKSSTFKSSIVEYNNNYAAGIARKASYFGTQQVGEWNGQIQAVGSKAKITLKNFYLYVDQADGTYLEFHCKL